MNNFYKKNNGRSKGFTLVETLVAISVLLMAVTAAFAAAQMGLSSSYYANAQVTAFYLAQDAMEYVRSVRDHNPSSNWLQGLESCIQNGPVVWPAVPVKCGVDSFQNLVSDSSGPCNPSQPLKLDPTSGIYNCTTPTTGGNSIFTRSVNISLVNTHEAQVTVRVDWILKGFPKYFIIRENLLNIR